MIEEKSSWVRYRHKSNRAIEYDVACYSITQGGPISTEFHGEQCFRIRTVRNISLPEEIHIPAFTEMPAEKFLEIYEVAA